MPISARATTRGAALAVAVIVVAGCSGGGSDEASDTGAVTADAPEDAGSDAAPGDDVETAPPAAGDGAEGEPAGDDVTADASSAVQIADQAAAGRDVIRTAAITLELDDPETAVDEVTAVTQAAGGFVSATDLRRDERTGEVGGTVTVRIPADDLLTTLDGLEQLAIDVPVRRIEEDDVTAEAVDLRAQVDNLTAYETELRTLLAEVREATADPDDLLPVFDRTQSVRADIDRITAQLDDLEDRVALSTITVTLRPAAGAEPIVTGSFTPRQTLDAAVAATGRALGNLADAAIWLVVTVLPVGLALVTAPLGIAWVWRRYRRGAAAGADASA